MLYMRTLQSSPPVTIIPLDSTHWFKEGSLSKKSPWTFNNFMILPEVSILYSATNSVKHAAMIGDPYTDFLISKVNWEAYISSCDHVIGDLSLCWFLVYQIL